MTQIEGSRALVVGATGVLGTQLAERLASGGARLALHGRDEARLAERAAGGTAAATIAVDLTDETAPEAIVERSVAALGGLDVIVLAAGAVGFDGVADTAAQDLETLFTVNALAPMRIISAALPALRESAQQGREPTVLALTGIVAELPTAGLASYSASKAALAAYLVAAGRELRRSGIRLLDAHPGHTETGLAERPLFGTAPKFPRGHQPGAVADRLVRAIVDGETTLPPGAFTGA
ncbi:SDR family NAD(P)-dependent oxidoreductase [Agromyces aurantiacus]|uniref:SDR family NAD(P)-dependent oxidoreductase n=1 Tax=Agromyces aurantiacus TaxID=165814 RepID=A0ABV9R098_9MICO|nr:SDR family NAD(P)-dependent oxidoreductase [Agromyces aurantiacus]MBM7505825.1 cyclic-di-GMP-binding biofilm dispersal mediator protein [Agromyces aurantiacus]